MVKSGSIQVRWRGTAVVRSRAFGMLRVVRVPPFAQESLNLQILPQFQV